MKKTSLFIQAFFCNLLLFSKVQGRNKWLFVDIVSFDFFITIMRLYAMINNVNGNRQKADPIYTLDKYLHERIDAFI